MSSETKTEIKNKFLRHVAVRTNIKNLLSGKYIQEDEQNSNYLLTENNQKIFRLNIIAVITKKEIHGSITNLLVEDGSGEIILRLFEENRTTETLVIGDVVLVVGRIRMYNQEKYISPEVIKKTNPLWLKSRSLELEEEEKTVKENKNLAKTVEKLQEEDFILPVQKLKNLVSELDNGNGVPIEELIEKSPLEKTEELVEKMLENGDVFQNSPGKIKVL